MMEETEKKVVIHCFKMPKMKLERILQAVCRQSQAENLFLFFLLCIRAKGKAEGQRGITLLKSNHRYHVH